MTEKTVVITFPYEGTLFIIIYSDSLYSPTALQSQKNIYISSTVTKRPLKSCRLHWDSCKYAFATLHTNSFLVKHMQPRRPYWEEFLHIQILSRNIMYLFIRDAHSTRYPKHPLIPHHLMDVKKTDLPQNVWCVFFQEMLRSENYLNAHQTF